jgi:hypothetical protein
LPFSWLLEEGWRLRAADSWDRRYAAMAEPAERADPKTPETVGVAISRRTFERLQSLADRWETSVDLALARLVWDALSRGSTASSGADKHPPEALSTDGLDPEVDAYWRELHDLTREESESAEAKSGSAPAR